MVLQTVRYCRSRIIMLPFIVSLFILLVTVIKWTDRSTLLSYGYSSLNLLPPSNNIDVKSQSNCKLYSKIKRELKLAQQINETNNSSQPVNDDILLPSVCLKAPSPDKLSWSLHPTNCAKDVYLIWLIKSSIYRNTLRKNIRNFWGQDMNYYIDGKTYTTRRLFLIGSDPQNSSIPSIRLESEIFNDILQGTFDDTFKSVTKKVVLGMNFVRENYPDVHYAVVVDDDAIVAPWNLLQHLDPISNLVDGQYFGGFFLHGKGPVRDPNSRWYASVEQYRCNGYPPYPLGTGFFMSKCTLDDLYEAVLEVELFGIDDVLFGGIAYELGINTTQMQFSGHYAECGQLTQAHRLVSTKGMIICHGTDYPHDQELLWSEFCHAPVENPVYAQYNVEYCKSSL